jgi:DALR anticodon binding domain
LKIFPGLSTIVIPVVPTIAGAIIKYLQLMTDKLVVNSPENFNDITGGLSSKLSSEYPSAQDFAESIRLVPTSQYQYVSTIAHQLAARFSVTPPEICQKLLLPTSEMRINQSDRLEISAWYNEAGYSYFQLTPESVMTWLNYIHDLPIDFYLNQSATSSPILDTNIAIYAHARCCSLLKLAETSRLVTITPDWQVSTPELDLFFQSSCLENQLRAASVSIFNTPAENRLIHTLMTVLDRIYSDNLPPNDRELSPNHSSGSRRQKRPPNWAKLTVDLAHSWLEFYRHCRIFGDLQSENPHLAIARCGLTAISRRYLQLLLENYLGVSAAVEL